MELKVCTEFFLALIYFVIIFTINFFLYKLLKIYIKNIIGLEKIKKISRMYPNNEFFSKLYNFSKSEFRNSNTLLSIQSLNTDRIDTLLIGNTYIYFATINKTNKETNYLNNYYFQLLTNQYLSFNFNLK